MEALLARSQISDTGRGALATHAIDATRDECKNPAHQCAESAKANNQRKICQGSFKEDPNYICKKHSPNCLRGSSPQQIAKLKFRVRVGLSIRDGELWWGGGFSSIENMQIQRPCFQMEADAPIDGSSEVVVSSDEQDNQLPKV